jgi:hypothetical protein
MAVASSPWDFQILYDPQPPFDAGSLVKAPLAAKDLLASGRL